MTAPGIEVRGLSLHVGDRRLFDNLSFTVPGQWWCRQRRRQNQPAAGDGRSGARHRGEVVASDGQPIQGRLAWMGQKDLLYG